MLLPEWGRVVLRLSKSENSSLSAELMNWSKVVLAKEAGGADRDRHIHKDKQVKNKTSSTNDRQNNNALLKE